MWGGVRRPRASLAVKHSGGAGAPPGTTRSPRQELAVRSRTGSPGLKRGPVPYGRPRVARRKAPAAILNRSRTLQDCAGRRAIPSSRYPEEGQRASRRRRRTKEQTGCATHRGNSGACPPGHARACGEVRERISTSAHPRAGGDPVAGTAFMSGFPLAREGAGLHGFPATWAQAHDKGSPAPYRNRLRRVAKTHRVQPCSTSNGFVTIRTHSSRA